MKRLRRFTIALIAFHMTAEAASAIPSFYYNDTDGNIILSNDTGGTLAAIVFGPVRNLVSASGKW